MTNISGYINILLLRLSLNSRPSSYYRTGYIRVEKTSLLERGGSIFEH